MFPLKKWSKAAIENEINWKIDLNNIHRLSIQSLPLKMSFETPTVIFFRQLFKFDTMRSRSEIGFNGRLPRLKYFFFLLRDSGQILFSSLRIRFPPTSLIDRTDSSWMKAKNVWVKTDEKEDTIVLFIQQKWRLLEEYGVFLYFLFISFFGQTHGSLW